MAQTQPLGTPAGSKIDNKHSRRQGKSHRRSAWACDECRLRKRKCDGSQPCRPCTASDLDCAYQVRRPAVTPTQRIRLLEQHLRLASTLLQDHANYLSPASRTAVKPILDVLNFWSDQPVSPAPSGQEEDEGQSSAMTSMLAGCQRLIASPPWSTRLYGPLSETAFILRTLEIFNRSDLQARQILFPAIEIFDLPFPSISDPGPELAFASDVLSSLPSLPDRDDTTRLIDFLFDLSHPLLNFLHERHFRDMVKMLYDQYQTQKDACARFLPLFHNVLALGCLFYHGLHGERGCETVIKDAMKHFHTGQRMLDLTQLDNLISMQSLLCGAVFLMSTSRMSRAHALLSLASSGAIRLGLHCDITASRQISLEERSMRILLFTALAKVDAYINLILDLPRLLPQNLIDAGVNNFYATFSNGSTVDLDPDMGASIKHLELLTYTRATRQAVFTDAATGEAVETVKLSILESLEKDHRRWTQDISHLLSRINKQHHHSMVSCDLEMAWNFAQLVLYRPFLTYLRVMARGRAIPLSQSRYALACIKLASTTILRLEATTRAKPGVPLSWETTYTLFLAIMCLVFLISSHNGTSEPTEAWQRSTTGIRILTANACADNCAVACLKMLKEVTRQLNHTVDFDFDQIQATTTGLCASQTCGSYSTPFHSGFPEAVSNLMGRVESTPIDVPETETEDSRTQSPTWSGRLANADEVLAYAEDLSLGIDFEDIVSVESDGNPDTQFTAAETTS